MKPTGLLIAVICLVGLSAARAEEDFASANVIMRGCRNFITQTPDLYTLQGVCAGAIGAIRDFGLVLGKICVPQQVTRGQATRVVVAYIDARPARQHENFNVLATEALMDAWPCR